MSDQTPIKTETAAPVTGSAILTAIAKAMGEMKRLAKDNKNTEQRYEFASVDDFLAMTGPICAANGIITLMDEVAVDNFEKAGKYGPTFWARYTFAITTYHASGEALPTVRRSVEVIRSGAQAAGSAQSYALKQYQRALYQIPTGDKDDPDHGATVEPPAAPPEQRRANPPRQEAKPTEQPAPRDPQAVQQGLLASIAKMGSVAQMDEQNAEGTKFAAAWQWLEDNHADLAATVKATFDSRRQSLGDAPSRGLADDEIPY